MERLTTNKKFVNSLCKCSTEDFKKRLKCANKDQIKTLVDLTFNIMKKNIPVCPKKVKFIKQNRKFLRHIVHPSFSLKSKKKYMIQKGGAWWSALFGGVGRGAISGTAGRSMLGNLARSSSVSSLGSLGSRVALTGSSAVARAGVGALARAGGSAVVKGAVKQGVGSASRRAVVGARGLRQKATAAKYKQMSSGSDTSAMSGAKMGSMPGYKPSQGLPGNPSWVGTGTPAAAIVPKNVGTPQ